MTMIGYARVSTGQQTLETQREELKAIGCTVLFEETGSGADDQRPVLAKAMGTIKKGDVLVVTRLDRIARSLPHLLSVVTEITEKEAAFKSIADPVDTSTAQGELILQIIGAIAQFERRLIADRTKAGVANARAQGRIPGNPKMKNMSEIDRIRLGQKRRDDYLQRLIDKEPNWLPEVRKHRPGLTWTSVTAKLNQRLEREGVPKAHHWTTEKLTRAARSYVKSGFLPAEVLKKSGRSIKQGEPERKAAVQSVVAGIIALAEELGIKPTLKHIAEQLKVNDQMPLRGAREWWPSTVKKLALEVEENGMLDRAREGGEIDHPLNNAEKLRERKRKSRHMSGRADQ